MLIDLNHRAKYRATGNDRSRFLNGQLTNDILSLQPGTAIYACALTAKGKLCADLYVAATKDNHYLDADPVLRESLAARLEKYIIADDVTLEDVTDEFGIFHLANLDSSGAHSELSLPSLFSENARGFQIASNRFGVPGIDLWFPAGDAASVLAQLKESPVDSETAEQLRIERGIARWGNELSENVIPTEAGLDKNAISYTKGCYLGQEVISRIKSVGHVNRLLRGLLPASGVAVEMGDKLFSSEQPNKEIGFITSVALNRSSGDAIALGYVKRGFDAPGSTLQVRRNNILIGPIEVRSLPFNSA
jgi:tRNA-modifying protein YgfZ